MNADEAQTQAVIAAKSTGKKAWIIFVAGDLDVTQIPEVAVKSHIIEVIYPTGYREYL